MINRHTLLAGAAILALLPVSAAAQTTIRIGQTVSGTLQPGDRMAADTTLFDDYLVDVGAGQRLVITMSSPDFDTFLLWGSGTTGSFQHIESDDDGGGGTNSRLEVTVGSSGRYVIRANALSRGESGRYTLSVAQGGGGGPVGPVGPQPPAGGGGARAITAGQTVSASLDRGDPRLDDESYYDLYLYRGRPGERIVVTMRSRAFDTYLAGGRLQGTAFQQQASDDDGAGGTDSRLEATLGSDGVYAIRANSLTGNQTGAYTISLSTSGGGGNRPAGGNSLSVGQSIEGRLDSSDRRLEQDNSHYDMYVVRGRPNEAVTITMASSAFDAFLLGAPGQSATSQDTDDDSGGGTNARLQVNLDRTGAYTVWANSYGANQTGAYTLTVEGGGGGAAPASGGGRPSIALGQTVNGRLDSSDPRLASDNSYYDQYIFRGTPGQQVVITMTSSAFDTYLTWGRMSGNQVQAEGNDDDSGGGTNAQVVATVPANGMVLIQANSYGADATGAYALSVTAAGGGRGPSRPVPSGSSTLAAGQTVSGSLARSDRMLADSSYFDQYVYQGAPGDRIRVTLSSAAFDAFLIGGRLEGDQLEDMEQNDDGAGGTNAQLEVTVGGNGVYTLRANSYGAGATGAYTLSVQRVGTGQTTRPGPSRPTPGPSRPTGPSSGGHKWRYSYLNPNSPSFRNLEQQMKQSQLLETFAQQLSDEFELPANARVELRLAQCGNVNAYYSPRERAVTFCYELLQHLAGRFVPDGRWTPQQEEALRGAVHFIMMHEVGHALVDVLDLPITGREEDAVDQLATVMLVETGEKGAEAALNGVLAIQPGRNATFDETDFADEHSLGPQRLFNVVCWIYGSDPSKYATVAQRSGLPRERAVRCNDEWDRLSKAWTRLLERD